MPSGSFRYSQRNASGHGGGGFPGGAGRQVEAVVAGETDRAGHDVGAFPVVPEDGATFGDLVAPLLRSIGAAMVMRRDTTGRERIALVPVTAPASTEAVPSTLTDADWTIARHPDSDTISDVITSRRYETDHADNGEGDPRLIFTMTDNGAVLSGLPSFKVQGDPKLSKELEARVKETEDIGIEVRGHYQATLWALFVFWILWLLALVFWRRPQKPKPVPVRPPLTLAEQLRLLLGELEQGGLSPEQKARLEMLLLRCWREGLVPAEAPMADVLAAIARGERTGEALDRLQRWLHRPGSGVADAEIAVLIRQHLPAPGAVRP